MMMRFFSFAFVLLGLFGREAFSACPSLEDPCMNEQNHQKCQELVDKGCMNLIWMESCPLQFACATYDRTNLRKIPPKPKPQPVPDSCVSLYVYDDEKCTGKPHRTITFPTWSEPGSQCYHDVSLGHFSVKDQYCNLETGNWHETVFMGSKDCSKKWWTHTDGFDLTFTTDGCIGGYSLAKCHLGPCDRPAQENSNEQFFEDAVALNIVEEKLATISLIETKEE